MNVLANNTHVTTKKQWTKVKLKQKKKDRSKSPGLVLVLIHLKYFFTICCSLSPLKDREKTMAEISAILAYRLFQTDYQIENIIISYIVNKTTGTIFLTMDKYHTVSSLIEFFLSITKAVNKYLNQPNNLITGFQLASITTDISLDMIPFITFSNNNKDLLKVIRKQVYFAYKIEVVQTGYLVPDLFKRC